MFDMDDNALFSSEVFRNFVNGELRKEAEEKQKAKELEDTILDTFLDLQKKINSSVVLKQQFKRVQDRMKVDAAYREANNEAFVRGIMLLKFEDE